MRHRLRARLLGDGDRALLLGRLDRPAAFDLELLDLAFLGDALLLECALRGDARLLDRLARQDLGALSLLVAVGPLARHVGALGGALGLDILLLGEPRMLERAIDLQRLPLCVEILVADLDHRVLLDVVPDLLAPLDLLGEPRQALGVEGVRRVEELHGGLVELGERYGLELQAVLQQVLGDDAAHPLDVVATPLVHLLHGHLGRHGAQCIDELALDQFAQRIGLHGALAERLGSVGDGVVGRLDADVELAYHVDAHAVAGDERLVAAARHLEPERVHVDRDDLVHDRQHEGAAVHHHLLPGQAGAYEGALLGRAQVEPVEQPDDDRHDDGDDDQGQDKDAELGSAHGVLPPIS